jgi:hypothetical protein
MRLKRRNEWTTLWCMRRTLVCLIIVGILGGCRQHGTPAAAYRNWGDRLAVAAGLRELGLVWPCQVKEKQTKLVATYGRKPLDQCFRMDPPRRWHGVWEDHFEGQIFCPNAVKQCPNGGQRIWLDYASERRPAVLQRRGGGTYAVEFIGRRTAVKGRYGHMGGSDYELIVDRMLAIKQLRPGIEPREDGTLK